MKYITRFNPTANGNLHLGHLYIMLFNEHMAHESGGKFYVRFENNQVDTLNDLDYYRTSAFCDLQEDAIKWLEIPVDGWFRQSDMGLEMMQFVADHVIPGHGWWIPEYKWPYSIPINPALGEYNLEEGEWFPCAPFVTYSKVIYDELRGVNVLIRGDDLRSEFALYQYFRNLLRLPEIDHYYLPRLYGPEGEIVSKFHGAKTILEYKDAGWTPEDLKDLLAESTLKDPAAGWRLTNVKKHPRLSEDFSLSVGNNDRDRVTVTYGNVRGN